MPNPVFIKSAAARRDFPPDEGREAAVAGRSNSGKSSALNALVGRTGLARVGKTPGRTQLVNFFGLEPGARLVDLPGYGFARVPDTVRERWRVLVEAYFASRGSLRGLLITVDARRGLTEQDERLLSWAGALEVPRFVLLTKADKLARGRALAKRRETAAALPADVGAALFSARSGLGVEEARAVLEAWLELAAPLGK